MSIEPSASTTSPSSASDPQQQVHQLDDGLILNALQEALLLLTSTSSSYAELAQLNRRAAIRLRYSLLHLSARSSREQTRLSQLTQSPTTSTRLLLPGALARVRNPE